MAWSDIKYSTGDPAQEAYSVTSVILARGPLASYLIYVYQ